MSEIRVGVFGASGKMGSEVIRAVGRAEGMTAVGGVDLGEPRENVGRAQVVVDFTHPNAVMENIEWAVSRGIHMVIGTTGFTPERLDTVRDLVAKHPEVGILIASNFSIGAVLMMQFAAKAAKFYESVGGRRAAPPEQGRRAVGHRGDDRAAHRRRPRRGRPRPGPGRDRARRRRPRRGRRRHPHARRAAPGLVAHQEVLFGALGETLTIRHDSFDRVSFMPGVVAGIRYIVEHPGLTLEMESVLGI